MAGGLVGEVVGPQGGQDQAQVGPQHPVVIEDGHVVELAADLLGDGLAPLRLPTVPGRVEPGLEQPHQQPGHGGVGAQHPLDVGVAEPGASLPQVLGVGAQHHDLAPAQLGVQHQGVEPVVLDLPAPQRVQRVLDQALDRARVRQLAEPAPGTRRAPRRPRRLPAPLGRSPKS